MANAVALGDRQVVRHRRKPADRDGHEHEIRTVERAVELEGLFDGDARAVLLVVVLCRGADQVQPLRVDVRQGQPQVVEPLGVDELANEAVGPGVAAGADDCDLHVMLPSEFALLWRTSTSATTC